MRSLGSVTTGFNRWVAVPTAPPGNSVVATFQLSLGLSWTLQTVLFKPPNMFMGYNNGQPYWRFVAATASDLHVLRPTTILGYSAPFVPVSVDSFRFFVDSQSRSVQGIKVSSYEIPMVDRTG
jgi:hypothetical protein